MMVLLWSWIYLFIYLLMEGHGFILTIIISKKYKDKGLFI